MREWTKRWKIVTAILLIAALVCGCGKLSAISDKKGEKEYGKAETMVFLTTERLRYEELYSEKIWSAPVDNRGTSFETTLLLQIHDFMRELKIMSLMAHDKKIELSGKEKGQVKEAAEQYFAALGAEAAEQFGLTQKDVENLYSDYWRAEKLVEQLTQGMNLEVSDSEAKVVTVSQIELADQATADEVLSKVQTEGTDFNSVAKEYSTDQEIKKQIFRGLRGEEYEAAAYGLAVGQISGIVADGGKYYILKCASDYDESATRIHKEQMIREKKNQAFYSSYQEFRDKIVLTEDSDLWADLTIQASPKVEADFLKVFEEVCKTE